YEADHHRRRPASAVCQRIGVRSRALLRQAVDRGRGITLRGRTAAIREGAPGAARVVLRPRRDPQQARTCHARRAGGRLCRAPRLSPGVHPRQARAVGEADTGPPAVGGWLTGYSPRKSFANRGVTVDSPPSGSVSRWAPCGDFITRNRLSCPPEVGWGW